MDYKLASPKNRIEDMVKECNTAYNHLISNIPILFNIKIRKLIISGDSAGGFLSLNLTNFLIKNKLRVPDGIILFYPCTRLVFKEMCPSHLLALKDCMIDSTFLSQIMNITLDVELYYERKLNINETYNFHLTAPEIVENYPPVYIIVGSNDPIKDESYRLADFLLSHNVTVELKEYLYFPHGFINITSLIDRFYVKGLDQWKEYANKIFQNKTECNSVTDTKSNSDFEN